MSCLYEFGTLRNIKEADGAESRALDESRDILKQYFITIFLKFIHALHVSCLSLWL